MSSEIDFLNRQIAHWRDVLANTDPNDHIKRAHAERELRNYETWLQSRQEQKKTKRREAGDFTAFLNNLFCERN